MRIQTDVSMGEFPRYRVVIRDNSIAGDGLFKALGLVTQEEVLDTDLSVSKEEFFYKKADIVLDYITNKGAKATLAVIDIDKYEGLLDVFGEGTASGLLHEVVARCKTSFREADVIGYFGNGRFGLILLEAGLDSARIPLNRLRSLITHQPMFYGENQNVRATVSIAFCEMDLERTPSQMVALCNEKLDAHADEVDVLIAV